MNDKRVRQHLKAYDFGTLFREELGWNHYRTAVPVAVEGQTFTLAPVAERNGVVTLQCGPQADGKIPEYPLRRKIEQEVTKSVQEHIIVFTDAAKTTQVWQWVRREPGKPAAYREHALDTRHQSGEALVQKLHHIAFDLDDEETLTLTLVGAGARKAFDVEKVTKKFYELFRKEHADFLKSIQGIDLPDDRAWYTSVMLNRLMFVYFIQKKRFLDDDDQYLRKRLKRVQDEKGAGHFHDFYRYFLLRLFHEGLGQKPEDRTPEQSTELDALLGKVPYLNGGIFSPHSLEDRYSGIQIEDAAFERIFDFFDQYQWHLDERPLRDDREINPDVLGYIFEKYINQKEMGAYYTKEDITEYIGRNTILPYLFDAAQPECAIAFREDGSVWGLLREDPDRYIFEAVKKGVELPLPSNIEAGVSDVAKRGDWNRPAPEEVALPTEIWREVVARRQRYAEARAKMAAGEVHGINDLITLNLNIRQFAQDVIEHCEGPETLRAFWKSLQSMRVLDPTVGSGAFLFAALNILEPLYEAVLERMESFVGDANRADPEHAGTKFLDFRQTLERIDKHPNRKHFIYKTIIVNNLFGVDIMEEATEICKLRLFLKLVAQVESVGDLEPLPDIDFNIRAGNTLVGYAQIDDIDRLWAATGRFAFERDRDKLEMMAKAYADMLHDFRDEQLGLQVPRHVSKRDVERAANEELRPELDKDLWRLYRTVGKVSDKITLAQFRATHAPMHWFVEFPEVMAHGGFDVIIGNPPYVEYSKVKDKYEVFGYSTFDCADLYALTVERVNTLMKVAGRVGMIVPLASISVSKIAPLRSHLLTKYKRLWYASFGFRPSKLFEGVNLRLSILLGKNGGQGDGGAYSSRYMLWSHEERAHLFKTLHYVQPLPLSATAFQKINDALGLTVAAKVAIAGAMVSRFLVKSGGSVIHYHRSPLYWIRAMNFEPYFKSDTKERSVHHFRDIRAADAKTGKLIGAVLNSSLFYMQFTMMGNCRNLTGDDVSGLQIGSPDKCTFDECSRLFDALMDDYRQKSQITVRYNCEYQTFFPGLSKPIVDEIDRVLARHYGFTDEELDFIVNYDIKYRMGRGGEDEGEE